MLSKAVVNPYEMMPQDTYYRIDINAFNRGIVSSRDIQVVVMDTWSNLMAARDEYENGNNNYIYIKAYDLPRNLRPKHAFLELEKDGKTTKIGLFHLKTIQEISHYGQMCEDPNLASKKQENLTIKKQKQKYLDSVVLPLIAKLNNGEKLSNDEWAAINIELPNKIQNELLNDIDQGDGIFHYDKYTWRYSQLDSESLTTNNYSKVFGIKDMNISEISQRGADYFKEKLQNRFMNDVAAIDSNGYMLFTTDGEQTNVMSKAEFEAAGDTRDYIEVDPDIDEEGYRLSEDGNKMYKLPDGAKIYRSNISGFDVETIVLNNFVSDLERPKDMKMNPKIYLLDTNYWTFYKNGNENLQPINSLVEMNNDVISTIAQEQYNSFMKAKLDVVARIPSQSMAFAMVMENIGYLPFTNNLRIVPLEHFYIQGSDVDIDKAYALMAYLNRNGMYKEKTYPIIKNVYSKEQLDIDGQNLNNDIISIIKDRGNGDGLMNKISAKILEYLNNGMDAVICEKYIADELLQIGFRDNILLNSIFRNIGIMSQAQIKLGGNGQNGINIMQNTIRKNIIDLYHNPKTLFAANYPTTMVPVREAVEASGRDKELRNSLDPTTNILVNQTCAVGKKGVGISANSQKGFYALTTTFEDKYRKGQSTLNMIYLGELPSDWRFNGKDHLFSLGFAGARINKVAIDQLVTAFEDGNRYTEINGGSISEDGTINQNTQYKLKYDNGVLYIHKTVSDSIQILSDDIYILEMSEDDFNKNLNFIYNENITDINLSNLENVIQTMKKIQVGTDIHDVTCTLLNGAIISSATDNAKEMRMDLLNMTPEILPAYEFLLSLGIEIKQAAKILLDPILPALVSISRGNLFNKQKSRGRIASILKNKGRASFDIKGNKYNLGDYLVKNFGINNSNLSDKLNILTKIFIGADELTEFSQILSINGGINVTTGSPIIYEFNFQDKINKKFSTNELKRSGEFSYDEFVNSLKEGAEYAAFWADLVQGKTLAYNILDTLISVDHFRSMVQVPAQFNRIMEMLSGDIRYLHGWLKSKKNIYEINEDNIKKILRGINDKKILDFLLTLDFEYKSRFKYELNGSKIVDNAAVVKGDEEYTYNLNSKDCIGILNFKKTVEEEILPEMISRFGDNAFVQNIVFNSFIWNSAGVRVLALASDIDLSDATMATEAIAIKTKYNEIKDEVINGHTISD